MYQWGDHKVCLEVSASNYMVDLWGNVIILENTVMLYVFINHFVKKVIKVGKQG